MSRENVALVRRIWEAADRRDTETVLSFYDPEVELDLSGLPEEAREGDFYRGHQGLRRLFTEWREIWQHAESNVVELIEAGERVVGVYTFRGEGRGSGIPIERTFAAVWTIRDGKAVRVEWFLARKEALEAVELRE